MSLCAWELGDGRQKEVNIQSQHDGGSVGRFCCCCSERWLPSWIGLYSCLKDPVHSLQILRGVALSMEAQLTSVAKSAFHQLRLLQQPQRETFGGTKASNRYISSS